MIQRTFPFLKVIFNLDLININLQVGTFLILKVEEGENRIRKHNDPIQLDNTSGWKPNSFAWECQAKVQG